MSEWVSEWEGEWVSEGECEWVIDWEIEGVSECVSEWAISILQIFLKIDCDPCTDLKNACEWLTRFFGFSNLFYVIFIYNIWTQNRWEL